MKKNVRDGYQSLIARRWPLTLVNVLFLVGSLVALEYFFVNQPDTRGLPWDQVAKLAFDKAYDNSECRLAGAFLGAANAVDDVAWHGAMSIIPGFADTTAKVLMWIAFLAWTGFGAVIFSRVLLGVTVLCEGDRRGGGTATQSRTFISAFWVTILILAVLCFYAAWRLGDAQRQLPVSHDAQRSRPVDPCKGFHVDAKSLQERVSEEVSLGTDKAYATVDGRIDSALDKAFMKAEKGVDDYLYWYYSLKGEYQRLVSAVFGDVRELMRKQLHQHLFEKTGFERYVETTSDSLEKDSLDEMTRLAASVHITIADSVRCARFFLPDIDYNSLGDLKSEQFRAATSGTAGVGTATVVAKSGSAAAGKLAAKGAMKSATGVLAKAGTKKAGSLALASLGGAAACAPGGPIAVLCGVGAGFAVWLGVDKVMIEVDESLNRDDMREKLLQGLSDYREELERDLKLFHRQRISFYAQEIVDTTNKVFNPSRQGT